MNQTVKVKLTEVGKTILKEQHDRQIREMVGMGFNCYWDFELKLDSEGYYSTQLWQLFEDFGQHIGVVLQLPFETEILIPMKED